MTEQDARAVVIAEARANLARSETYLTWLQQEVAMTRRDIESWQSRVYCDVRDFQTRPEIDEEGTG